MKQPKDFIARNMKQFEMQQQAVSQVNCNILLNPIISIDPTFLQDLPPDPSPNPNHKPKLNPKPEIPKINLAKICKPNKTNSKAINTKTHYPGLYMNLKRLGVS